MKLRISIEAGDGRELFVSALKDWLQKDLIEQGFFFTSDVSIRHYAVSSVLKTEVTKRKKPKT